MTFYQPGGEKKKYITSVETYRQINSKFFDNRNLQPGEAMTIRHLSKEEATHRDVSFVPTKLDPNKEDKTRRKDRMTHRIINFNREKEAFDNPRHEELPDHYPINYNEDEEEYDYRNLVASNNQLNQERRPIQRSEVDYLRQEVWNLRRLIALDEKKKRVHHQDVRVVNTGNGPYIIPVNFPIQESDRYNDRFCPERNRERNHAAEYNLDKKVKANDREDQESKSPHQGTKAVDDHKQEDRNIRAMNNLNLNK